MDNSGQHLADRVSIPFKRESISKVAILRTIDAYENPSFNSLQTGKHIQSGLASIIVEIVKSFQFPSNGKAYPKVYDEIIEYAHKNS